MGLKEMGLNPDQFVDEETGLKARLYQNTETGEYTLAFAGTEGCLSCTDWRQNGKELSGASEQYVQAVNLGRRVAKAVYNQGGDLSFTGHSLGGGLAQAAVWGLSYGPYREAKLHNSAGESLITSLRTARRVFDPVIDVQNYAVVGYPLTTTPAIGGVLKNTTLMHMRPGSSWRPGYRHSMIAVRIAIDYGLFEPFRRVHL